MKKIVVLATGGTIAGAGKPGENLGYRSGSISGVELVKSVPGLSGLAELEVEQVCNINSDDVNSKIWIALANRIQAVCERGDVDGVVVMHGTDTMEETAFFLSLVLDVEKPVVLTGAMRPATSLAPDGPANLCFAVGIAAGCNGAACRGVCVAFAGKVLDARRVQKVHANDLDAFDAIGSACGSVLPKFSIEGFSELPKVAVLYFHADADSALLEFAAQRSAGIVIAGAGAGEFSKEWADALARVNVPVVVASRIGRGTVMPEGLLVPGTIPAYSLPPQKAAVLLRLALTETQNVEKIKEFFEEFV
ncbi:MAG: asparaginase [Fibrobacter sp.]|nr:asparaginase [Fibrobacter sp.]MBQ3778806.1 asparaginase [Fibrobacter sp.]